LTVVGYTRRRLLSFRIPSSCLPPPADAFDLHCKTDIWGSPKNTLPEVQIHNLVNFSWMRGLDSQLTHAFRSHSLSSCHLWDRRLGSSDWTISDGISPANSFSPVVGSHDWLEMVPSGRASAGRFCLSPFHFDGAWTFGRHLEAWLSASTPLIYLVLKIP